MPAQQPLTGAEKRQLLLMLQEAQSRGIEIPKEIANQFSQKAEPKNIEWPLDENGWFVGNDGSRFRPNETMKNFVLDDARYISFFGGRGCVSGDTKINGVPIAERNSIGLVDTIYGKRYASPGYLKGTDTLYKVRTQLGSLVSVTEHHRFLTPDGWRRLNQLECGSLVLSDGTLNAGSVKKITPDLTGRYLLDFHLSDELHTLLERVSLSILRKLRKTDDENSALFSPFHLSIVNFFPALLFLLGVEHSLGLVSLSQIRSLFQVLLQSLSRTYQKDTFQQFFQMEQQFFVGDDFHDQNSFQFHEVQSELRSPKHSTSQQFQEMTFLKDTFLHTLPTADAYSFSTQYYPALSVYRNEAGNQSQDFCKFLLLCQEIDQILLKLGSHFRFLKLASQFHPDGDFVSSVLDKQIYRSFLQLYGLVPEKYSTALQYLVQTFLPELVGRLENDLLFEDDLSYNLQENDIIYNSTLQFDKIQDIQFDKFGDFYDISVPEIEHYSAGGLYHHNSGKTATACQKVLHKIKKGESGVVISPTFENFKYSTWPELKKWIPWNCVVPSQRNRRLPQWQPQAPFVIVFMNGAKMSLKGLKNADGARGSNVNWFWYDESGMDKDGLAWQLANASVRIGDKPQAFTTTTPKGMGHWLYKFFISQDFGEGAKEEFDKVANGRDFIKVYKTTTYDNRENLDPAFFASCLATYPSGYLREQELNGEFANEGGKIGDRTWFRETMLVEVPEEWVIEKKVRYWDMAASSQKIVNGKKTNDPDSSVGSLLSKTKERTYKIVIENQVAGKWKWEELKPKIVETARKDGMYVTVCIEEEPGSGGKNQVAEMQMHFKELGMVEWKIIGQRPTDRLIEANTWFSLAAAGRMFLLRGGWNEEFLNETDGFTQILHDDRVTSVSGAVRYLSPYKSFRTQGFITV